MTLENVNPNPASIIQGEMEVASSRTGYRDDWDESPAASTVKKLTDPSEIYGQGYNYPTQVSDALTLTDSVEKILYAGNLTNRRQYGVKLFLIKEFERMKMLDLPLDPKIFGIFSKLKTLGAMMSILEITSSNSLDKSYQDTLVDAITGGASRMMKKFANKPPEEDNLKK